MAATQILFTAVDTQGNDCLFGTDSATGQTSKLASFAGSDITLMNTGKARAALFTVRTAQTTELWCWDGESAIRLCIQVDPDQFTSLPGGQTLFTVMDEDGVHRIWISDGTTAGTRAIRADLQAQDEAWQAIPLGAGKALFTATADDATRGIWVTDGTSAGTTLLQSGDAAPLDPSAFAALDNGKVLFMASDPQHGRELWITDGTSAGTRLVKDLTAGMDDSKPQSSIVSIGGGKALVQIGATLWCTTGTAAGTVALADLTSHYMTHLTALGDGRAMFATTGWAGMTEDGPRINANTWITDGTARGTRLLNTTAQQIYAYPAYPPGSEYRPAQANGFTRLSSGRVVFSNTDSQGTELWASDGTAAGTVRLADLSQGAWTLTGLNGHSATLQLSSSPRSFLALGNGRAIFCAKSAGNPSVTNGDHLWLTDGTTVTVLTGNTAGYTPIRLSAGTPLSDGRIVFVSGDSDANGVVHEQMWVTDGTANGTRMLFDLGTSSLGIDLTQGDSWIKQLSLLSMNDSAPPTAGNDQITGTAGADRLDGLGGNDHLIGLAGNDTLIGGLGADTLAGGAGDDTYVVDNAKDTITEALDAGVDTVQSALAWTLADNLEHLTLLDKATSATGNSAANRLTGNAAANVLDG